MAADPLPDVDGGYLETLLAESRVEVGYADHKASMVLASLGIGFSAFLGGLYASSWEPSDLPLVGTLFWWSGAVGALLSVAAAALAVWPRTGDDTISVERPVYYWGQVAEVDSPQVLIEKLAEHPPDAKRRSVDQLHALSKLVATKYSWVRWALRCAGGAAAMLVASGLIELIW